MTDPKEPRQFSDMSDYPQDGYGNLDADRPDRIPADDEQIEKEEDEGIPLENYEVGEGDDFNYSVNEDFE